VGLTGDLTFSKNECPTTGAIFSSQNASVTTIAHAHGALLIGIAKTLQTAIVSYADN
jgi:hypothetical protein